MKFYSIFFVFAIAYIVNLGASENTASLQELVASFSAAVSVGSQECDLTAKTCACMSPKWAPGAKADFFEKKPKGFKGGCLKPVAENLAITNKRLAIG